ncbi:hypothetical protein [Streptomyces rubellomurinus]|uniref:hypothetical protein n=1 Tax=Streptomyces rubellomurinus (strain ATCC 31215) TaxID=359131 RepID=UPI00099D1B99|nr:hypothetical protein [Streptomyces rubellomurinus]
MRIRTATAALAVGLLAAGLTACSSTSSDSTKAAASASSTAGAQPTSAPAAAQEPAPAGTTAAAPAPAGTGPGGLPPKPDAATTAKYIAALTAIDPEIVGDKPDRAVSRGRDQCSSVAEFSKDTAKLVDLTNKRFTSPKHPDGFGAEKAAKILVVVRASICPTY